MPKLEFGGSGELTKVSVAGGCVCGGRGRGAWEGRLEERAGARWQRVCGEHLRDCRQRRD